MYKSDNQWLVSVMDKTTRTSPKKTSWESWPESYDWEKKSEDNETSCIKISGCISIGKLYRTVDKDLVRELFLGLLVM